MPARIPYNSLTWNVFMEEFNSRKIIVHNVFDHIGVMDELKKNFKKNKGDRKAFEEELRSSLKYHYWAKCEWEVIITSLFDSKKVNTDRKVDVFEQINLNWDRFTDYVWSTLTRT